MKTPYRTLALATLSSAILAACGGGGGSGGTIPIDNGPQSVAITEANAKPVAADALESVRNTSATRGATGLPIGVQVDTGAQWSATGAMALVARLAATAPRSGPMPVGMFVSQTVNCPLGGTMSISGNVASSMGMTPGDSFTISTSNCQVSDAGVTMVMNGQMSMTFVSGTMDMMPFHAVLQVTATNLSVTAGNVTTISNGDVRMDWNAMSDMSQMMQSTGSSMMTRETVGGVTRTSTMTNYTQGMTLSGTTLTGTLSATVLTDNSHFASGGATYTVTTPTPVVWDSVTGMVSSGMVKVVGALNSQLTMTFTGNDNATIALDINGDGTAEKTLATTVAELAGLL